MIITLRAYSVTEGGTYEIIEGDKALDAGTEYVRVTVLDWDAVTVTEGDPDVLTITNLDGIAVATGRAL